ncbi:hypothetical protein L7F22_028682 [Adiantum nelumboides]|nr:hypothetical protein [Adiantum nelumboides]
MMLVILQMSLFTKLLLDVSFMYATQDQIFSLQSHRRFDDCKKVGGQDLYTEIYRVVTSSDHENRQPELFTVDALGTFGGSMFVLVTGAMHKNNNTRKFVQSFILAPQIKGYYVLNDILRYVDEWTEHSVDNKSYGMQEEYGDSGDNNQRGTLPSRKWQRS